MNKFTFILLVFLATGITKISAQDDFMMGPPPGGFGQGMQDGEGGPGMPPDGKGPGGGGQSYVNATGMKTFKGKKIVSGKTIQSKTKDKSAVLATSGTLDISHCVLSNTADASSTDDASFYGVNAVLLAQPSPKKDKVIINSSHNSIKGSGKGANGVFAYGNGTVNSTNDYIYQTGGNARGVLCSGGGTVNIENDTIVTMSGSSSCIATDRGGGNVNVKGGIYTCNGTNSAGLYSTGNINASDATFISNGGEAMVIEGTNYITTKNCDFTSKKDKWGVLLYQSFSGDAEVGNEATLSMTGGSLTYEGKKTGMFYNTNSTDSLYLNSVKLHNASDTLFCAKKGGWGNRDTARRGGTLAVLCENQQLDGIIYADANSSIKMTFAKGTTFSGSIDPKKEAKYIKLQLDDNSTWRVTADSFINGELVFDTTPTETNTINNIVGNGHNVYYSAAKNAALAGGSFPLKGGGCLMPY